MISVKKFTYIFFLCILLNAGHAGAEEVFAQTEKETPFRIGTCLGYSFAGYREETDMPLNRYANSFIFILDGNIQKGNFLYSFNSIFLLGKTMAIEMNSDQLYFSYYQKEANFLMASFENSLDYRLWGSGAFPGYLGGAIRLDASLIHLQETFYYSLTAVLSLNVHVTQKWIINENNSFIFSASVPVFGFAVRPPYYGLLYSPLDLSMDFVSIHNYWALFCDAKYQYRFNKLLSLYANLGIELSHIDFPQPRKNALINLSAGISFIF